MAILIRDADRSDADAIAQVHIASWRSAYRHIFPPTVFDDPDFDRSRIAMWRSWSHSPTPDRRLVVAVDKGLVVGFAHSGHTDGDGVVAGEIFGFYTHPDSWGSGAASALMTCSLDHLRLLGHSRAVLWTLGEAHRARAFYEKSGFVPSGRTDLWTRYPDHPVDDVEYVRAL